jgi:hypothetical protein
MQIVWILWVFGDSLCNSMMYIYRLLIGCIGFDYIDLTTVDLIRQTGRQTFRQPAYGSLRKQSQL